MRWVLVIIFVLTLFTVQSFPVDAAAKPKVSSPSVSASGQFIKSKNAVRVFIKNIKGAARVTYALTYQGNGLAQGVEGSFVPGKKISFSKDIYLGTCSRKVCVAHRNVKNLQLQVTTKFTNGKSSSKTYKIK